MLSRSSMGIDALRLAGVHPGEVLAEELAAMGVSVATLCSAIDMPMAHIAEMIQGRLSVTPDSALRLARYFGNSARFWINLQTNYDLSMAGTAPASSRRVRSSMSQIAGY